jgi:hypothetical protein
MMNPAEERPGAGATDERFAVLWADYLEGELDAAGTAELNDLLRDERLLSLAADLYQTHRRLGLFVAARHEAGGAITDTDAFVADVMHRLCADDDTLSRSEVAHLTAGSAANTLDGRQTSRRWLRHAVLGGGSLLAAFAVAVVTTSNLSRTPDQPTGAPGSVAATPGVAGTLPVRFDSLARARFFGRETPTRQAEVVADENYVLTAGSVQLRFPVGATAIIDAPAVFRVRGADCLAVDAGRCSVHAPEGAEGFYVDTPATRVIDRGTRFVVNVGETTVTEVQVIEGAAELVTANDRTPTVLGLTAGDVVRLNPAGVVDRIVIERQQPLGNAYQRQLPDRVVGFTASLRHPAAGLTAPATTTAAADGIDTLDTISVQRGGKLRSYGADRLIGVTPLHFRAGDSRSNIATPATSTFVAATLTEADRRAVLESDRLLTTGLINPGGSKIPLAADPVLAAAAATAADTTPGLAVRFVRPVVNDNGPDVVFFDLQLVTDPPQGDAFHVSPLRFAAGLRSHTVDAYDIDLTSPESQMLVRFRVFDLVRQATSLDDLLTIPTTGGNDMMIRARSCVVGIDLSDLGYPPGAAVEGLFIQDADDDAKAVDPVFIAGLPPLDD